MLKPLVLKLACAHPQNREWIMSQLTSSERGVIQSLLNEVRELGLDKDIATVRAVISDHEDLLNVQNSSPIEGIENFDPFWQQLVHGQPVNDATTKTSVSLAVPPQLSAALISIAKSKSP